MNLISLLAAGPELVNGSVKLARGAGDGFAELLSSLRGDSVPRVEFQPLRADTESALNRVVREAPRAAAPEVLRWFGLPQNVSWQGTSLTDKVGELATGALAGSAVLGQLGSLAGSVAPALGVASQVLGVVAGAAPMIGLAGRAIGFFAGVAERLFGGGPAPEPTRFVPLGEKKATVRNEQGMNVPIPAGLITFVQPPPPSVPDSPEGVKFFRMDAATGEVHAEPSRAARPFVPAAETPSLPSSEARANATSELAFMHAGQGQAIQPETGFPQPVGVMPTVSQILAADAPRWEGLPAAVSPSAGPVEASLLDFGALSAPLPLAVPRAPGSQAFDFAPATEERLFLPAGELSSPFPVSARMTPASFEPTFTTALLGEADAEVHQLGAATPDASAPPAPVAPGAASGQAAPQPADGPVQARFQPAAPVSGQAPAPASAQVAPRHRDAAVPVASEPAVPAQVGPHHVEAPASAHVPATSQQGPVSGQLAAQLADARVPAISEQGPISAQVAADARVPATFQQSPTSGQVGVQRADVPPAYETVPPTSGPIAARFADGPGAVASRQATPAPGQAAPPAPVSPHQAEGAWSADASHQVDAPTTRVAPHQDAPAPVAPHADTAAPVAPRHADTAAPVASRPADASAPVAPQPADAPAPVAPHADAPAPVASRQADTAAPVAPRQADAPAPAASRHADASAPVAPPHAEFAARVPAQHGEALTPGPAGAPARVDARQPVTPTSGQTASQHENTSAPHASAPPAFAQAESRQAGSPATPQQATPKRAPANQAGTQPPGRPAPTAPFQEAGATRQPAAEEPAPKSEPAGKPARAPQFQPLAPEPRAQASKVWGALEPSRPQSQPAPTANRPFVLSENVNLPDQPKVARTVGQGLASRLTPLQREQGPQARFTPAAGLTRAGQQEPEDKPARVEQVFPQVRPEPLTDSIQQPNMTASTMVNNGEADVPVRIEKLAEVLKQRVRRSLEEMARGPRQLELRLDPPRLGKLQIELTVQPDSTVTARVQAENPQALYALGNQLPELRERLAQSGIELRDFSLGQNQQGSQNPFQQPQDGQPRRKPRPQVAVQNARSQRDSGLSLRV